MKNLLLMVFLTLVIGACGNKVTLDTGTGNGSGTGTGTACTSCRIFVTAATTSGSMGVAGADSLCMADANKPATGTYKAMIVEELGVRRACTTAGCGGGASENIGWVMHPNTAYKRPDGTAIGTTNAGGVFAFPFTNSMATAGSVWTGMFMDWTTFAGATCSSWTSAVGSARYGSANNLNSPGISLSSSACATLYSLAYVEQ